MAQETTPTGYKGEFMSPGTLLPPVPGNGTFDVTGAADAKWLQIAYDPSSEKQLTVTVGKAKDGETILMDPGAKITFQVKKPDAGVSIHYDGKAKGTWEWMAEGGKGK